MTEEILNEMPMEDIEYAVASEIAYKYYDTGNDADTTQRALDTYLENYTLDPEYSNDNSSTIIRPDGSVILAYRGTRPTNLDDLNTDAAIFSGQHRTDNPHPRFIEAQNHYDFVTDKYGEVDVTGHSLGGTIADYIGRNNNARAVVFNPGETPFSTQVIPTSAQSRTTIYRTNTFDVVSFSNSLYAHSNNIRVVPQTLGTGVFDSWLNSHSLANFLPRAELLPLSTEPDVIIPSQISVPVMREERKVTKSQEKIIQNVCLEQPDLLECKESVNKLKINLTGGGTLKKQVGKQL